MERELRHFQQRRRVSFPVVGQGQHYGVVHGFFADATDAGVGQPEQGIPPLHNLEQRLRAIHPNVAAPQMNEFMEQHCAEL